MSSVNKYRFEESEIRLVDQDGAPWFVLSDLCKVIGILNPSQAAKRLDEDERCTLCLNEGAGNPAITIVSESAFYKLVLRSRKRQAKKFMRWVTRDVLPSIRRTGSYTDPERSDRAAIGANAASDFVTVGKILDMLPAVLGYERLSEAAGSLCVTSAAKALQVPPGKLFELLHAEGWIYRRQGSGVWLGYSDYIRKGLITHKVFTSASGAGEERIHEQVRITPKGLTELTTLVQSIEQGQRKRSRLKSGAEPATRIAR